MIRGSRGGDGGSAWSSTSASASASGGGSGSASRSRCPGITQSVTSHTLSPHPLSTTIAASIVIMLIIIIFFFIINKVITKQIESEHQEQEQDRSNHLGNSNFGW